MAKLSARGRYVVAEFDKAESSRHYKLMSDGKLLYKAIWVGPDGKRHSFGYKLSRHTNPDILIQAGYIRTNI